MEVRHILLVLITLSNAERNCVIPAKLVLGLRANNRMNLTVDALLCVGSLSDIQLLQAGTHRS